MNQELPPASEADSLFLLTDELIWVFEGQEAPSDSDDEGRLSEYLSDMLAMMPADVTGRHLMRIQFSRPQTAGYTKNSDGQRVYQGSPLRVYHQHRLSAGKIHAHLTQIKLPGEPFHGRAGFDFSSGHVSLEDTGPVSRVILGDYSLHFGQGLTLWSTPSFGKSGTYHRAPYKYGRGARPYYSSDQHHFFRGISVQLRPPSSMFRSDNTPELTLFYSRKPRSAVLADSMFIRPPVQSPYHRTKAELERRHNISETVIGGHFRFPVRTLGALGLTGYHYSLDHPVLPLSQQHPMQGQSNLVGGVDMTFSVSRFRFFMEASINKPKRLVHSDFFSDSNDETGISGLSSGGISWVAGVMGTGTQGMDWVFARRSLGTYYWSEFTHIFAEGSRPSNQSGWYAGIRIRPSSKASYSGFIDRFRFPEADHRRNAGDSGWEHASEIRLRPVRSGHILLGLRYKTSQMRIHQPDRYDRDIRSTGDQSRLTFRVQTRWSAGHRLTLTSQANIVR
ncbi:hypothetical protein QLX67_09230, partial [Balneolaceae bacterium ANBcel3]|nr:hypothetical protein [Balneolaceae bacterium ANBcel3]